MPARPTAGFYESLAKFEAEQRGAKPIGDKPWSANTTPAHFIAANKYTIKTTCFVCEALRTCSFHIHREEDRRLSQPLLSFCYDHESVGQQMRAVLQREVDAIVSYYTDRAARMEKQRG